MDSVIPFTNDAADMSSALRRLGFEVTTEFDADRVKLTEALRGFTRRSAGADVALVFYAGHGIEMDGVNYLVPVDARLERDVDVRFETVTLDDLLVSTAGASLRLVILDACRNNPLARSMQRTAASRSVSGGSFGNLNEDLLGDETLVAYAAAAGTTAADGRGRNSPYTAALLEYLEQPLEIGLLFRRVRAQVLASTRGEQRPHEYHSLLSEHYLSVPPTADSVTVVAAAAPAPDVAPVDVEHLDVGRLRLVAEQGDARAQTELGERYEEGRGGVVQNYEAAVALYRQAAEQGDPRGQGNLGAMYASGRGVAQDDEVAAQWYRRAVKQGGARARRTASAPCTATVAAACCRMTERLSGGSASPQSRETPAGRPTSAPCTATDGRGVARDDAEAVRWYRRAAEQGFAHAQSSLGVMYSNGRGGRQDHAEAVRRYRQAAEQGFAHAQNNLGIMYEYGRGVRRDRVEAVRWYRMAAEQGREDAQKALDRLR